MATVDLRRQSPKLTTLPEDVNVACEELDVSENYLPALPATVSSFTQLRVLQASDNILTTPEFERILVGVTLAVTPRILSDDRVMIEVIPIISSLKGFTDFQFDGAAFSAPNIALQELATQVIARPGETVHLGGLITERFTEQMKGLPRDRNSWNPLDKMLGLLFDSVANEVERRELVLTITPSIVEG